MGEETACRNAFLLRFEQLCHALKSIVRTPKNKPPADSANAGGSRYNAKCERLFTPACSNAGRACVPRLSAGYSPVEKRKLPILRSSRCLATWPGFRCRINHGKKSSRLVVSRGTGMTCRPRDRSETSQFPIAITRFCVPLTPPRVNVTGTESLAAIFGTTTLN